MKRKKKIFTILCICLLVIILSSGIRICTSWHTIEEIFPGGGLLYLMFEEPGSQLRELSKTGFWKNFSSLAIWNEIGLDMNQVDTAVSNRNLMNIFDGKTGVSVYKNSDGEEISLFLSDMGMKGAIITALIGRRIIKIPGLDSGHRCALCGNVFAVSDSREILKKTLKSSGIGVLDCSEKYRKIMRKLPDGGNILYIDVENARKNEELVHGLSGNITELISAIGFRQSRDSGRALIESYILTVEMSDLQKKLNVFKQLKEYPHSIDFFQVESLFRISAGVDGKELFGTFPGWIGFFSFIDSVLGEEPGISQGEWLGEEVSFGLIDIDMQNFFPSLKMGIASEFKNREEALKFVRTLEITQVSSYKGYQIFSLNPASTAGMFANCIFLGRFLILTLDIETSRAIIDKLVSGRTEMQKTFPSVFEKGTNAFFCFNLENLFIKASELVEFAKMFGFLKSKNDLVIRHLPSILKCLCVLKFAAGNVFIEGDGIRIRFFIDT